MLLHAADAVQCGYTKILLCTVDTDVLVLAVALQELHDDKRIEIGSGLALAYSFAILQPMKSLARSNLKSQEHFLSSMPLQAATPCPVSMGKERRRRWAHGRGYKLQAAFLSLANYYTF